MKIGDVVVMSYDKLSKARAYGMVVCSRGFTMHYDAPFRLRSRELVEVLWPDGNIKCHIETDLELINESR